MLLPTIDEEVEFPYLRESYVENLTKYFIMIGFKPELVHEDHDYYWLVEDAVNELEDETNRVKERFAIASLDKHRKLGKMAKGRNGPSECIATYL